ncbi:MAG: response regulator [Candidatus Kapabacteria bacterium]|nr:response regulator [Ignavibacteriota bacterium]MCW5884687.1 response regulator [Candidatus Kapabacteria bacterium]
MVDYSILVIDDDVWMQRILSKTMQSYGFKITYLASNGFDGIAYAIEYKPTLIIIDILMPELSGHQIVKILKKIKLTQNIPILVISAMSDVENLGLAVKNGVAGFVSKPFTRATIYDKLLEIFGKEKLTMISRGERIDGFEQPKDYSVVKSKEPETLDLLLSESPIIKNITEHEIAPKSEPTPVSKQDQLLQHYQEDEKRSIESIRKMLLKKK